MRVIDIFDRELTEFHTTADRIHTENRKPAEIIKIITKSVHVKPLNRTLILENKF